MSTLALSDDDAERGEQAVKVVVLGDSSVGKTAICCRFSQHVYPQKYTQVEGEEGLLEGEGGVREGNG